MSSLIGKNRSFVCFRRGCSRTECGFIWQPGRNFFTAPQITWKVLKFSTDALQEIVTRSYQSFFFLHFHLCDSNTGRLLWPRRSKTKTNCVWINDIIQQSRRNWFLKRAALNLNTTRLMFLASCANIGQPPLSPLRFQRSLSRRSGGPRSWGTFAGVFFRHHGAERSVQPFLQSHQKQAPCDSPSWKRKFELLSF